jgi:hypothetical protein
MASRVRAEKPDAEPVKATPVSADEKLIGEFEAMLEVDKLSLDDQLEQHPDLLYRIGEMVIERQADLKAAKRDLEEAVATVDKELRRDAEMTETKMTDTAVNRAAKLDRRVISATNRSDDLEYWVARWQKLEAAYSSRQSIMRELVTLFSNGYWSDASKPRATGSRKSQAGERAREALAAERRRRRG